MTSLANFTGQATLVGAGSLTYTPTTNVQVIVNWSCGASTNVQAGGATIGQASTGAFASGTAYFFVGAGQSFVVTATGSNAVTSSRSL